MGALIARRQRATLRIRISRGKAYPHWGAPRVSARGSCRHLDTAYLFVTDDESIAHADDAVARRADLRIVRDQQDRLAALSSSNTASGEAWISISSWNCHDILPRAR